MFWGDDRKLTDVTDVADVVMMSHLSVETGPDSVRVTEEFVEGIAGVKRD